MVYLYFFPAYIASGLTYFKVFVLFQSLLCSVLGYRQFPEGQGIYVDLGYYQILRIVGVTILDQFFCIIIIQISRTVTVYREDLGCAVLISCFVSLSQQSEYRCHPYFL